MRKSQGNHARTSRRTPFLRQVGIALRLRCPRCGRERLFQGLIRMRHRCPLCDFDFQRDPGFYLGAIYFNYGLTAVVVTGLFIGLTMGTDLPREWRLGLSLLPALLFPFWFFRYARSLWLGMDYYIDRGTREGS